MSGDSQTSQSGDVDLGEIFAAVWHAKTNILIFSLLATALAWFVLLTIEPRYRSETRILIRQNQPVLGAEENNGARLPADLDQQGIASKIQLLRSRSIAIKVANQMKLEERPEFETRLNRSTFDRLLSAIGLSEDPNAVTPEDRVLEAYYDRLQVYQAETSRVIVVEFWSHDQNLAAAIPNLITDEFVAMQEELNRGAKPDELQKLQTEVEALGDAVAKDEAAIARFRNQRDLLQGSNNDTLATQELSELATELGQVKTQLSQARASAASASSAIKAGALNQSSAVLQSPLIQRLRERQVTLRAQRSDLLADLLPRHPRIIRLQSQIDSLEDQINREAKKVSSSLQQEVSVLESRLNDLEERRSELKSEAGRVGSELAELQGMERELNAQRQILSQYLVRLKEAKSRQQRAFVPTDVFIFARAQVQSKPFFPKRLPTLSAVFFGTVLLGALLTLAWTSLTGKRVPTDSPKPIDIPDFADMTLELDEVVAADLLPEPIAPVDAADSEEIENALGESLTVAKSLAMLGKARIAVVSPEDGARSSGTIALARHLASWGNTTVVIDLTGNAASTEQMLETQNYIGIKDLLAGQCEFRDAIHSDNQSEAHIVPSGRAESHEAAKGAAKIPSILDVLHQAYQFVIVDCGDTNADGLARISNKTTINVISAEKPRSSAVRLASESFTQAGYRPPLIVTGNRKQETSAPIAA